MNRFVECSTPFGITEFDTDYAVPNSITGHVCSTPFGITEFDTTNNGPNG